MPDTTSPIVPDRSADDLGGLPVDGLRALRTELGEAEVAYAYALCMCRGRLELVEAELRGRDTAPSPGPGGAGGRPEAPAAKVTTGRPASALVPPGWADDLLTEAHEALPPARLSRLDRVDAEQLEALADTLSGLERRLAADHSRLEARLDGVHSELVLRYQRGDGLDQLLSPLDP